MWHFVAGTMLTSGNVDVYTAFTKMWLRKMSLDYIPEELICGVSWHWVLGECHLSKGKHQQDVCIEKLFSWYVEHTEEHGDFILLVLSKTKGDLEIQSSKECWCIVTASLVYLSSGRAIQNAGLLRMVWYIDERSYDLVVYNNFYDRIWHRFLFSFLWKSTSTDRWRQSQDLLF